ncbi:hypothetical protein [Halobellus limi]|jgi:hypothetical protein|uniref:Uncharacterized protein n=1 Tax=Halobellus limi TaxID=699433 RepID=A0A1H6B657_9EURY|nr:hypothetical protein [Halobellus limi]QCC49160.1 hypothetical protein DV707_15510 [Halobellus limi]SEG56323.1 hypothetical protein SAMN04488133_2628 [Halobellus limi]
MTGMKQGAGENPFADDGDEADVEETPGGEAASEPTDEGSESGQSMQIPYKFRRDGVQDGRNRVPLFLQPETKTAERETLRDLEDHFDDDVSLTDLREALVMVGLEHREEVEAQLEKWGYGMTFE